MKIRAVVYLIVIVTMVACSDTKSRVTTVAKDNSLVDSLCSHYEQDSLAVGLFFPADNAWNKTIDGDSVDLNSDKIIQHYRGDLTTEQEFVRVEVVVPYNVVNHQDTIATIHGELPSQHPDGSYDDLPENSHKFPLFKGMRIEQGDPHLVIVDTGTNMLYELYKPRYDSNTNTWYHQGAAIFDLASNMPRSGSFLTSADAAGLPVMPGLVRMDEIKRGHINHALRLTLNNTFAGYISPATHFTGNNTNDSLLPMGARLRLKSTFDTTGFNDTLKVIIQCLKTYGLIVADNGTNFAISGVEDCRFQGFPNFHPYSQVIQGILFNGNSFRMINKDGSNEIRISDFEVIKVRNIVRRPNFSNKGLKT